MAKMEKLSDVLILKIRFLISWVYRYRLNSEIKINITFLLRKEIENSIFRTCGISINKLITVKNRSIIKYGALLNNLIPEKALDKFL